MSWWKNLVKYAAPVVGAVGGAAGGGALGLSPALGGALGGAIGGFAGGEIGGSSTKGSLIEAGLGGLGGYLAGPTIADWTGTTPVSAAAGAGFGMPSGSNPLNTIGQGSAMSASIPAQAIGSTAAGAAGAAAGGAASSVAPGIGGAAVSGINDFLGRNPELLAGAAGLGALAMNQGGGDYPEAKALEQQAKLLGSQGQAGLNGTLSPSAAVAFQDAVTTIKSSYANMGIPGGSTMEQQEIAAARERAVAASVQEGMQQLGMSQSLYGELLGYQQQQDSELSSAISNLMGSVGYGLGAHP